MPSFRLQLGFIGFFAFSAAHGALSFPGCTDVADSEIRIDTLVSKKQHGLIEPMKMAFDLVAGPGEDAADKVDVYFTRRTGQLQKYDARAKTVVTLGTFPLTYKGVSLLNNSPTTVSDGLLGIALDPQFKANHRLYLYYSYKDDNESSWRVSRFKLNAAHTVLDMASEEVVIKIPTRMRAQHPGGAIQFDSYGDLWITTGNDYIGNDADEFPVWSSGNTNDLRGKILRIHPLETAADGKLYSIPAGNLFPPGKAKTLPEIYIMGARNPYTLSLDPVRRWASWGDVGPDDKNMDGGAMNAPGSNDNTEEHNLSTGPGNYGYPFFAGKNFVTKSGMKPAQPIIPANTDWKGYAKGLDTLPPAQPAMNAYPKACAIAGPIYRYDSTLFSSIKLPPHFHRKWFITDFNSNSGTVLTAVSVSDDGLTRTGSEPVMPKVKAVKALDLQAGPDGALYISNYAGYRSSTDQTTIVRVGYVGACRPGTVSARAPVAPAGPRLEIRQAPLLTVALASAGDFSLEVRDLAGRVLARRTGHGHAKVALPEIGKPGLYLLTVDAPEGRVTRKLARE